MKNLFQRLLKSNDKKSERRSLVEKQLDDDVLEQITSGVSSGCHQPN